ncbi:MAG: hypothetical protein N5P05_004195 (plasmid) [Chroococcopsis gigantea SAG 12.99]|nr:hypothetical protein [Chroococcopsis gigantea SAG 12.99]
MEFSTEYWKTHQQGASRRREILALLQKAHYINPTLAGLTLADIAAAVRLSPRQVRRHLKRLISEGRIYREGERYFYRHNANIWCRNLNYHKEKLWN